MSNSGKKWDVNQILTFVGVIIGLLSFIAAVLALVVTITTPELRNYFGLENDNKQPVIHKADPQEYIIGENKSELAQEAKTRLSVSFHDDTGAITAKLIISPAGKEEIVLPTVGIGSKEFASSTGVFLVHVLNVDWNSRTITVQVSRKI